MLKWQVARMIFHVWSFLNKGCALKATFRGAYEVEAYEAQKLRLILRVGDCREKDTNSYANQRGFCGE